LVHNKLEVLNSGSDPTLTPIFGPFTGNWHPLTPHTTILVLLCGICDVGKDTLLLASIVLPPMSPKLQLHGWTLKTMNLKIPIVYFLQMSMHTTT
jgi:hypothetical protein